MFAESASPVLFSNRYYEAFPSKNSFLKIITIVLKCVFYRSWNQADHTFFRCLRGASLRTGCSHVYQSTDFTLYMVQNNPLLLSSPPDTYTIEHPPGPANWWKTSINHYLIRYSKGVRLERRDGSKWRCPKRRVAYPHHNYDDPINEITTQICGLGCVWVTFDLLSLEAFLWIATNSINEMFIARQAAVNFCTRYFFSTSMGNLERYWNFAWGGTRS